ncbi:amidase signature domain-containing protein [Ilyonectria destructans]|nr:amidase signature domain-containing protein [Ilyonectria destructans]
MSSKSLVTIQRGSVIRGSPEYEALRDSIRTEIWSSVPQELLLPESIIQNPPKDVTGIPRKLILSDKELEITETYDATALAHAIASQKLTAVSVATAFAKRAIISHQLTGCLSEWFMDEAVEHAKILDAHLKKTGKPVGPLHGVPISIKEHIPIAGHWSSVGYLETRRKDMVDCQMVEILRRAGAVFYCKTNQPQSIMHLESHSSLGRVLNPYNIGLSAGGSTGGEAALIALRGSILGVGTDIGGSIRGPAGFCGIYGFKPTSYTLPMKDFLAGGFGAELNVLCSTGPMCTSLRDLEYFMSVVASTKPYLEDPRLIPIPWTGSALTQKPSRAPLKIGIMMNDGVIEPQPPVTRALKWAQSQIKKSSDLILKSFQPYETAKAMQNIRLAYWPDGGRAVKARLAATGEPMFPLTQWIIKDAEGAELTASGVLEQRIARDEFRCNFARHWEAQDVDVVICPVFVGPACEHDTAFYWNYTALWNYVDYPAAVIPTPIKAGCVGAESYASITPLSDQCKHVRQLWANGDFEGAPINIQIVARRYHDNGLFVALDMLKDVLHMGQ